MVNIYDAYGEDGDYTYINSGIGSGVDIRTDGNFYRNSGNCGYQYARCAIGFSDIEGHGKGIRLWPTQQTTAWYGGRLSFTGGGGALQTFFGFVDSDSVLRIGLSFATGVGLVNVYKFDSIGTPTQLGSTSTNGFSYNSSVPDNLSIHFNYSTTGFITIYINGAQVLTYSGDITTDSVTQLAGTYHAPWILTTLSQNQLTWFSENILADSDTRNLAVITNVAVGAGTTDQWSGSYTDVTGLQATDTTYNTATTSGDTQLYAMGELQTGSFNILAKVTALRATQGIGGLSQIALTEIVDSGTYSTGSVTIPNSFGQVQFIQQTNPATSSAWSLSDLNTSRQSGYTATT